MDSSLDEELEGLSAAGRRRRLRRIDKKEGSIVWIDGRRLISFGSNDYLGLSQHARMIAAASLSILDWGSGSTGSRLTTGNLCPHEELEAAIAAFKHTQSAVAFTSGYAANVGAIQALAGEEDLILSDSLNHASLIDGCRLSRATVRVYSHNDTGHVRDLLNDRSNFRRLLMITDGVFSMDGDLARLPDLADLADECDGWLMVDDAHGTGVYGESGSGTVEHFGLLGRVPIQMGTLSKACGSVGGFVAGSRSLVELLKNKARSFIYSTALPPAVVESARMSLEIIASSPSLRARLHHNVKRLRTGLNILAIDAAAGDSPIIPVIYGSEMAAISISKQLEEAGFWIPAIRPPTVPPGTSRLRITVSADHTDDQIDALLKVLGEIDKSVSSK